MFLPLLYLLYGGNGGKSKGGGERGWWCWRVRIMGDRGDGEEDKRWWMVWFALRTLAIVVELESVISVQKQDMNGSLVVTARMDEGVHVGRDAMEGEVWCGVVLALVASPVMMAWWRGLMFFLQGGIVTSALLRWQCALHFLVILQGGVTASNGNERVAWSGSSVVAGTRPTMAADKAEDEAESVVAMDACAAALVTDGAEWTRQRRGVADEAEGMAEDMAKCETGVIGVTEVVGNAEARTGEANGVAWLRGGAVAEGTVGRTGTAEAGDMVDMTEESEAEMAGNETGTERGDMEAMMGKGYVKSESSSS
ncbi:hypothetical protein F5148DRAFT_1152203 [Russula earlei]|uniref:Uncharacterized protein n=1 Tax=Russula earlei TaxID=71964 RepID=A0ACC0TYC4_9AGAM|nr:hypothetical protein F5148DRAFT_1152203 [Russula earlei]